MSKIPKIVNFSPDGAIIFFKKSITLLDSKSKQKLFLISGVQSLLSILDLVGVALMGVLAAVSVKAFNHNQLEVRLRRS